MTEASRFVLWGSAGHAKVLAEIITHIGGRVIALFDNRDLPSAIPGVPIYVGEAGFHRWTEVVGKLQEVAGLVAIGGGRGQDRLLIQDFFRQHGLCLPVLRHQTAIVSPSATLGCGSQLLALSNIAADAHLGQACIVNHRASVDHECIVGDGVHLAPGATLCGCVTVGDYAFIGAGAVVLPRVKIGKGAVIGAGAVVTRDVPDGGTVIGNPAKMTSMSR